MNTTTAQQMVAEDSLHPFLRITMSLFVRMNNSILTATGQRHKYILSPPGQQSAKFHTITFLDIVHPFRL